jgi:hypothetical protein
MYYIIYKITNKINDKIYIGSHKTNNVNDDYMGSGKHLKAAINKYGVDNFSKEILFVFDNSEEMYDKEAEIVNEDFVKNKNTYNMKLGGFGGFDHINDNVELRTLKNKKAKYWMDRAIYEKYGVDNIGRTDKFRREQKQRMLDEIQSGKIRLKKFDCTGKKHKPETIEKLRASKQGYGIGEQNSQFGTMWITNGVENKKIKKQEEVPVGWSRGRVK